MMHTFVQYFILLNLFETKMFTFTLYTIIYILYYYVREDNVMYKIRNGSCLVLLRCLVKNNYKFLILFSKKKNLYWGNLEIIEI